MLMKSKNMGLNGYVTEIALVHKLKHSFSHSVSQRLDFRCLSTFSLMLAFIPLSSGKTLLLKLYLKEKNQSQIDEILQCIVTFIYKVALW